MKLSPLKISKNLFMDQHGRTVLLRGVNLGGDSKVPAVPNGGTHIPNDFSNHKSVSFIGRPFALEEAEEHFSRLKRWGFNVVRLLTTWEAIEHLGPGQYDTEYLDYFTEICKLAGEYGIYVFIDFHQDVWSRMTGGDGAPCWIFEKLGIDYTKISQSDSAIVMQSSYDYSDPRARQQDNFPMMCWSSNYNYPLNGIMWTLFFGGKDFAPEFLIDGINVQDYLQNHLLDCMYEIAYRVKDFPHVLGFDSLNEPSNGFIGKPMSNKKSKSSKDEMVIPGFQFFPIDCLRISNGYSVEIPEMGISFLQFGKIVEKRRVEKNKNKVSIWSEGMTDPFQQAGAWTLNEKGEYTVLREDFFQKINGIPVNFDNDYLTPYTHRLVERVRQINPGWIIFLNSETLTYHFNMKLPENLPENIVNASHWYDGLINYTKRNLYPFSWDLIKNKIVFGKKGIQKRYVNHLEFYKKDSDSQNGGECPTLLGEFGIPFDIDNCKAYKNWAKGKWKNKIWNSHVIALDLMYNAMDSLLLHGTQWNYTASNRNDLRIGDGWNQEDFSIYSIDQKDVSAGLDSGGRALEGFVRPFPHYVQGELLETTFDRKKGEYFLSYMSNPGIKGPTIIFVPKIQFPNGFTVEAEGSIVEEYPEEQYVQIMSKVEGKLSVYIRRKR